MMPTVAVVGFGAHSWQSVERTRCFYERALSSVCYLTEYADLEPDTCRADAILNFSGTTAWEFSSHPPCTVVIAMHGGVVLDSEYIHLRAPALQSTDALLVNCSSDSSILEAIFQGSGPLITQLPLPVDQAIFHPEDVAKCRTAMPIPESDHVVGFVGRLLPQKNLHQFLRLCAKLKDLLHPESLGIIVIGNYWTDYPVLDYQNASYRTNIAKMVEALDLEHNLAYFPASLPETALAVAYNAMDLLIHPTNSLDENFGYAPVEAMACGTPVLGTAYGGLKDTVLSGDTGFLMPTWTTRTGIRCDTIAGLREAYRILTEGTLKAKMSRAAALHVSTEFSDQRCSAILRQGLLEAVDRYYSAPRDSVRVGSLPQSRPVSGLLPEVSRPWEAFEPAVSHYVSSGVPVAHRASVVGVTSPLLNLGKGRFTLADPAWPVTISLDSIQQRIALACETPVTVADVLSGDETELTRIQQLIDLGILLCSN